MYCPPLSTSLIMPLAEVVTQASDCRRSSSRPTLCATHGRIHPASWQMARKLDTTAELLARIRHGDLSARDTLTARYRPILRAWARGRLPQFARDLNQTEDLVQNALIATLNQLDKFEIRHEGALLAYLRVTLNNGIREELRRVRKRPTRVDLDSKIADHQLSVVERAISGEVLERYEAALAGLSEEQREAVILRLEFGYRYREIAKAMGKPSPDAARMVVYRAMVHVVEAMNEYRV